MADFKQLLDENKKQTAALNKLAGIEAAVAKTNESIAKTNESVKKVSEEVDQNGKDAARQDAARKGWETRRDKAQTKAEAAARGSAAKATEGKREEGFRWAKLIDGIKGVKDGILSFGSSLKDKAKEFAGTSFGRALIGAGLAALLAFMSSPYWEKTIALVKEKLVPALQWIHEKLGTFGSVMLGVGLLFSGKIIRGVMKVFQAVQWFRKVFMAQYVPKVWGMFRSIMSSMGGRIAKAIDFLKTGALAMRAWVMGTFIPKVMEMWSNAMSSMKGGIIKAIDWVKKGAMAFRVFMMGSFIPGIMGLFSTIMATVTPILIAAAPFIAIGAAIVAVLYAMYESFQKAFAVFEETGSIGDAIAMFFASMITAPLRWAKSLLSTVLEWLGFDEAAAWLDNIDILEPVFSFFKGIIDWVKLLFSDPLAALGAFWTGLLGGFDSLMGIITYPIDAAINWIMGLFGWSTPDGEPFSLWGTIKAGLSAVWEWIAGLFDFDFSGAIQDLLPSWTPNWIKSALGLPVAVDPDADPLEQAQQTGFYDKDMIGNSEIDRSKVNMASTPMLQAILDDNDISSDDRQFIERELANRRAIEAASQGNGNQINSSSAEYVNGQGQPIVQVIQQGPPVAGGGSGSDAPRTRIMPITTGNPDSTTQRMVEGSH